MAERAFAGASKDVARLTLSVVIPVYNERATLPEILRLVMLARSL